MDKEWWLGLQSSVASKSGLWVSLALGIPQAFRALWTCHLEKGGGAWSQPYIWKLSLMSSRDQFPWGGLFHACPEKSSLFSLPFLFLFCSSWGADSTETCRDRSARVPEVCIEFWSRIIYCMVTESVYVVWMHAWLSVFSVFCTARPQNPALN